MKNCLTCKYEPDWDSVSYGSIQWHWGKCKKDAVFLNGGVLNKHKDGRVSYNLEYERDIEVFNCYLWESKE